MSTKLRESVANSLIEAWCACGNGGAASTTRCSHPFSPSTPLHTHIHTLSKSANCDVPAGVPTQNDLREQSRQLNSEVRPLPAPACLFPVP